MKKIFAIAIAVVSSTACNNIETSNDTRDSSTNSATTTATPSDTTISASTTYTASDGDVTYRDKKVRVMKNGEWVDADKDVTLDNGVVVYRSGRVKKNSKR